MADPNTERRLSTLEEAFAELSGLTDFQVAAPMWKVEQVGVGFTLGVEIDDESPGPIGQLVTGILQVGKYSATLDYRDNTLEAEDIGEEIALFDLQNNIANYPSPTIAPDSQWNITWQGTEPFGNFVVCLNNGTLNIDPSVTTSWLPFLPDWTPYYNLLPWDALTKFKAAPVDSNGDAIPNQVVLSSGALWVCIADNDGIKPGSALDDDGNPIWQLSWQLWDPTQYVAQQWVNPYAGELVYTAGGYYLQTDPSAGAAPPPGPGWTLVTSAAQDSSGNWYINGAAGTTPPGASWIFVGAWDPVPYMGVSGCNGAYPVGTVFAYGGATWICNTSDYGPPQAPNWTQAPATLQVNGAVYRATTSYSAGDCTQPLLLDVYSFDGEPADAVDCPAPAMPTIPVSGVPVTGGCTCSGTPAAFVCITLINNGGTPIAVQANLQSGACTGGNGAVWVADGVPGLEEDNNAEVIFNVCGTTSALTIDAAEFLGPWLTFPNGITSVTNPSYSGTSVDGSVSASVSTGACPGGTGSLGNIGGTPVIGPTNNLPSLAIGNPALTGGSTLIIPITGLDTSTLSNNVPTLSSGTATFSAATTTTGTLTFTVAPSAGVLTLKVAVSSVSSGNAQPIATVVANPTVTSTTTPIGATAPAVRITGTGFNPAPAGNTVVFSNVTGATAGTVFAAAANGTWIDCYLSGITGTGALKAVVTSYGGSSGSAVEVAVVASSGPSLNQANDLILSNAASITLFGAGLGTGSIALSGGATGSITTAAAGSIVVALSGLTAGTLTAIVTDGSSNTNGSPMPVAVVLAPLSITPSTTNWTQGTATLVIAGVSFTAPGAPTPTVLLNGGAFTAFTVQSASATSITLAMQKSPPLGALTATISNPVTMADVQTVATVVAPSAPTVTANTTARAQTAWYLVVNGTNFDPIVANNTIAFSTLSAVGVVVSVTPNGASMTVRFTTRPTSTGSLTAVVTTVNGGSSGSAVEVANVVASAGMPTVTLSTASWISGILTINGTNFSSTPSQNQVNIATCGRAIRAQVLTATTTRLTVAILDQPSSCGLFASVNVNGINSQVVQVATVAPNALPKIVPSTANLPFAATSITVNGANFDPNAGNDSITLSGTSSPSGGTVATATTTQLSVTGITLTANGTLKAVVATTVGNSGTAVQIAAVTGAPPTVTMSSSSLALTATTLTIAGTNFDAVTPGNNTVTFSGAAAPASGTVTSATTTSLTVTSLTLTSAGILDAVVTTTAGNSGAAVEVALVTSVSTTTTSGGTIASTGSFSVVTSTGITNGMTLTITSAGAVGGSWSVTVTSHFGTVVVYALVSGSGTYSFGDAVT